MRRKQTGYISNQIGRVRSEKLGRWGVRRYGTVDHQPRAGSKKKKTTQNTKPKHSLHSHLFILPIQWRGAYQLLNLEVEPPASRNRCGAVTNPNAPVPVLQPHPAAQEQPAECPKIFSNNRSPVQLLSGICDYRSSPLRLPNPILTQRKNHHHWK